MAYCFPLFQWYDNYIMSPRLPGTYILTLTLKRRNLQEETVERH